MSRGLRCSCSRVDEAFDGCLLGIDSDGRLHLLVAVLVEPTTLPPDLQGITVRVIEVDRSYLDISARNHHEPIFTPLANLVFDGVAVQRRDPLAAVTGAIEDFRAALKLVTPDLTVGEQIGLFGELWVLRHVLLPNIGSRSCFLWSGPARERHDFGGEAVHIEVKTTTGSDEKHEISRIDQLRAPPGKRLLFASILLERSLAQSVREPRRRPSAVAPLRPTQARQVPRSRSWPHRATGWGLSGCPAGFGSERGPHGHRFGGSTWRADVLKAQLRSGSVSPRGGAKGVGQPAGPLTGA